VRVAAAVSDNPIPRSYWVLPGRLLAGEYPLDRKDDGSAPKLARLLAAGIDCFIDLTVPEEMPAYEGLLPVLVQYLRKPLPDHDVPKQIAHMQDIQQTIAHALAANRVIYLHCRAGIGRTGTVVGCRLVEQGLGGDDALVELLRLWQQNELARSWPSVPETDAQVKYVRDWEPHRTLQREAGAGAGAELSAVRTLRDRYLGCLLGLALGDALAAATQYKRPGSFAPVGDLLGGGPFELPRGAWSDDTAMALGIAESLAARGQFDHRDLLQRWLRWQSEGYLSATGQCVGITASTARALATAQWRRQSFAGSHDPLQTDPEPLVRVAPVVLYQFDQLEAALIDAVDAARMTCQAPLVLDSCRLLALMTHSALSGNPLERIVRLPATLLADAGLRREVAAIAAEPCSLPTADLPCEAGNDVLSALRAVRWALGTTGNFRSAVLAAVNLGGNSDVFGACCGLLAGAHYGANSIPAAWLQALAQREHITELADQLLTATLVRMGEAGVPQ
jgi:ADP-ribosylglycohydrolase